MQVLCEIQDKCSKHIHEFGIVDILFQITLDADSEMKKHCITKVTFIIEKYSKITMN